MEVVVGPHCYQLGSYSRKNSVKKEGKFHSLRTNFKSSQMAFLTSILFKFAFWFLSLQNFSRFSVILNECLLLLFFSLTCTCLRNVFKSDKRNCNYSSGCRPKIYSFPNGCLHSKHELNYFKQVSRKKKKTSRKTKPSFRTIPQPPLDFMVVILLYCDIGVFFLPSPKIQITQASHLWIIQSGKNEGEFIRRKENGSKILRQYCKSRLSSAHVHHLTDMNHALCISLCLPTSSLLLNPHLCIVLWFIITV